MDKAQMIEEKARFESKLAFWYEQHTFCITSSNFWYIYYQCSSIGADKTFLKIRSIFTSKSVRHGLKYEAAALAYYLDISLLFRN